MTDLAADLDGRQHAPRHAKLVRMREFGSAKLDVGISLMTAALILPFWQVASALHLAPHLFLPTPAKYTPRRNRCSDGYANATLGSMSAPASPAFSPPRRSPWVSAFP